MAFNCYLVDGGGSIIMAVYSRESLRANGMITYGTLIAIILTYMMVPLLAWMLNVAYPIETE